MHGTRRTRNGRYGAGLTAILVGILVLGGAHAQQVPEEEKYGGEIVVAVPAEPGTLDIQITTATFTSNTSQQFLETPFAFDGDFGVQGGLVETWELSDDGLTYTFHTRDDVLFHDGEAMTAEDVAASIERWSRVSSRGQVAAGAIENVEATGENTLLVELNTPFPALLALLAIPNAGAGVYPKEIIDRYPDEPIEEHIGTGPYRFVEWEANRHVLLERFEDYREQEPNLDNWAGSKIPYADTIRFLTVPDVSARLNGLVTGQYDLALELTSDFYGQLEGSERAEPVVIQPSVWLFHMFNKAQGIMTDPDLRRAIYTAMNLEEQLQAAAGDEQFWNLNHNLLPGATAWASEAGADVYNQANIDRARELAEEAGYAGETIRWIVRPQRDTHYNAALIAVEQLRQAGFVIDLISLEEVTFFDRRGQQELWDMFTSQGGFIPEPLLLNNITEQYHGWWVDDEKGAIMERLESSRTFEERFQAWEDLQAYAYEQMAYVMVGEVYGLAGKSQRLNDYQTAGTNLLLWDAWLSE